MPSYYLVLIARFLVSGMIWSPYHCIQILYYTFENCFFDLSSLLLSLIDKRLDKISRARLFTMFITCKTVFDV